MSKTYAKETVLSSTTDGTTTRLIVILSSTTDDESKKELLGSTGVPEVTLTETKYSSKSTMDTIKKPGL